MCVEQRHSLKNYYKYNDIDSNISVFHNFENENSSKQDFANIFNWKYFIELWGRVLLVSHFWACFLSDSNSFGSFMQKKKVIS